MTLDRRSGISLIEVMDRVLDKGIVIDYHARIHVLGIDVLTTVDARFVVASIETYFHYADTMMSVSGSSFSRERGIFGSPPRFRANP